MVAYVAVDVDNQAPSQLSVTINGGLESTSNPEVQLLIQSWDWINGQRDLGDIIVWGDVDPSFDPFIGTTEAASYWRSFRPFVPVLLSVGSGTKTINVKVRDMTGNTATTSGSIAYTVPTEPVVTIVRRPVYDKYSLHAGYDEVEFTWRVDQNIDDYEILQVDNIYDERSQGTVLPGQNLGGAPVAAGALTVTKVLTSSLLLTRPYSGGKVMKIFTKVGSNWYG